MLQPNSQDDKATSYCQALSNELSFPVSKFVEEHTTKEEGN